jgi:hypothetical protein
MDLIIKDFISADERVGKKDSSLKAYVKAALYSVVFYGILGFLVFQMSNVSSLD